jgi:hypothetical protein
MTTGSFKGLLAALTLLSCVDCAGLGGVKKETLNFTDEGFISDDIFQVIIKGFPDKKAKTLVEQRETARASAAAQAENTPLSKLAAYICAGQTDGIFETIEALQKHKKYGSIYEEYYLIDNSAVIVYRFRKNGLKKDMESAVCGGKK